MLTDSPVALISNMSVIPPFWVRRIRTLPLVLPYFSSVTSRIPLPGHPWAFLDQRHQNPKALRLAYELGRNLDALPRDATCGVGEGSSVAALSLSSSHLS